MLKEMFSFVKFFPFYQKNGFDALDFSNGTLILIYSK